MTQRFDAIVVGAGQAGPPLAGRLTAAGNTVGVVERKLIGGTCVNTGCIPTKTLVASAQAAHLARRGADYGVGTGAVSVDMAKVKARKDAIMLGDRNGFQAALSSRHINIAAHEIHEVGALQQQLRHPRIVVIGF